MRRTTNGVCAGGLGVVWLVALRLIGGCGDDDDSSGMVVDKRSELRVPLLLVFP